MDDESLGLGINDVQSNISSKDGFFEKNKKLIIISIFIFLIIIIVIILIIILNNSNENNKSKTQITGDIICVFNIQSKEQNTKILSDYFSKSSDFKIYIDNQEIKYSKEYKFPSVGYNQVTFTILDEINMDKMFKDVEHLISVNITSKTNLNIISMESAFDNCKDLEKFNIDGCNIENIKSMKRTFYNTKISDFNSTFLNIENMADMS